MNLFLVALLLVLPSRYAPVTVESASGSGITMSHEVPAPTARLGAYRVDVTLARDDGDVLPGGIDVAFFMRMNDRPWREAPIALVDSRGTWSVDLPAFARGALMRYRFEAHLPDGTTLALPVGSREDAADPSFRYLIVAPVPERVTILRDLALWLSLFFAAAASGFALRAGRRWSSRAQFDWAVIAGGLSAITFFVGAVCLGWIHSFYATGSKWATLAGGRNHVPYVSLGLALYWVVVMAGFGGRLVRASPPSSHAIRWGALAFGLGALGILFFLAMGPLTP